MLKSMMAGVALAGALFASTAEAGTPITVQVTCPLTGERFNFNTTASYSTWGRDLDGRQQGSWEFPLAIPQCPTTRFPVMEDMTPEELEAARALVETPGYQAVRGEASYYVLSYVMTQMEMGDPVDRAWHILQATWQVQNDPERYRRYASELTDRWDAVAPAFREESPEDWMWIETYVANVERQSGRLDAATARLAALEAAAGDDAELMERVALTRQLIADGNTRPFAPERGD